MTKKRLILIAALPLAIVVTFGILAMLPPRPGVTKANFDRIQHGMTKMEVEEIFGGKNTGIWADPKKQQVWDVVIGGQSFWKADDGSEAYIDFVHDGVTEKTWEPSTETLFHKIRRWLHLP